MTLALWLELRFAASRRIAALALAAGVAMMCCAAGCRSTAVAAVDPALARHARTASEAFHDGYDERAVARYRLALRRAWELDDAASIANTAFNLAACLAAMREYELARQALAEARAELIRSGESQVDAWLLEAKLARAEGRLEDAAYLADCVIEPLIRASADCSSGHRTQSIQHHAGAPGRTLAGANQAILQSCNPHHPDDDVCQSNLVSLALFRANLFLDQADIQRASVELHKAELARTELEKKRAGHVATQDPAMRAEIASTQSRLLLLQGRPLQAAQRLDDEVRWLKESEHYRELPLATVAAAEAFLLAERPREAAERFFRTARLLYGRDDLLAALYFLERAIELADELADVDLQLRGSLLLGEIDRVNSKRPSSSSDPFAASGAETPTPSPEELPLPAFDAPARAAAAELSAPQIDG